MAKIDPQSLIGAALITMALAACSSDGETMTGPNEEPAREFSDADRRVASALSISQNRAVTNADSPYSRALLCRNGMEALAERFQEAGGLSEQQRQGIEQARTYFDGQLRLLGESEGKSASDISADVQQTAEDNFDTAENARIAIACLRQLQEGG